MCAEYQINKQPVEIREWLKRQGESDSENVYRPRIKLFTTAPIVVGEDFRVEPMTFSLKPPAIKYATFNARLYDYDQRTDRIVAMGEKRTWKVPLAETRCLVPMTGFIEPIYTGTHAGEMVEFEDKVQDMVFAAGVYEVSVDPKTGGPYKGFSIIMDQPNDFIREVGHHRQPVFLRPAAFDEWLSSDLDVADAMTLLNSQRQPVDLKVKTDRKMAKGWEKRIATFVEKSAKELEFEALLKTKR
ncbi:hypothetical protein BH10BDE1_BH10BDE1_12720 [soil metagenome]